MADIACSPAVEKAVRDFFADTSDLPSAVVCSACEAGMLAAAKLRDIYNLPGTRSSLALRLTNKGEQRRAWQALASPNFVVINRDNTNIASALSEICSEKVIIKPIDSSGSRGITVMRRQDISRDALEWALTWSGSGELIIEEFVDGKEYTIESLRLHGKSYPILVTSKEKVAGTYSTVANLLVSSILSASQSKQIQLLIQQAHDALGYDNGVCHTEVIEDAKGRFWLVETAGRGAGFGVSEHFIKYATGYDYFEASLCFDLGLSVEVPPSNLPTLISAVRFLENVPGTLIDIVNDSDSEVHLLASPGTKLSPPRTDGDRMAYFYVQGHCHKVVNEKIMATLAKIHVKVE
ncbi:ATP-grasp domain-containing protein [Idiomarina fontislapidosi]|uniref:ATP-grasp domain-containing protein n=1 Tax=Idiomarina fontislapidosi TaxID=263723 RepID=UPI00130074DB|nr:ATP-grasp domain-containing protein [Idiomarina fontislapidosi]